MRIELIIGLYALLWFSRWLNVKNPPVMQGDRGHAGLGRSPGEENGNPLQYSCLENLMDVGAGWTTVHGVAKSWTRLIDFTFFLSFQHFCLENLMESDGLQSLGSLWATKHSHTWTAFPSS